MLRRQCSLSLAYAMATGRKLELLNIRRSEARAFMASVRQRIVCEICGKQPVDFHSDDHPRYPWRRLSSLVAGGASPSRLQREMDVCRPLCRTCHQVVDGRLAKFVSYQLTANGNALKTHCKRGHPFNDKNTRTSKGHRWCRVCEREKWRENRPQKRRRKSCHVGD